MSRQDDSTCFYVSPDGNDIRSGRTPRTISGCNDGPFATLARARDAIRAIRSRGGALPVSGVTVCVAGGTYCLDDSFRLGPEDSGTPERPIVYKAASDEPVRLLGGRVIRGFAPVSDSAALQRLDATARRHVVWADLRGAGITVFPSLSSRGFGRPQSPAHMELFFNGRPMILAQWPNAGECLTITGCTRPLKDEWGNEAGALDGGFTYDGERPRRWRWNEDIWVHGYWSYDWANTYERVCRLDPQARIVETHPPHGAYNFRRGQRFYFLNVLEELDEPGEYYVDRDSGALYFWPPTPVDAGEAVVSVVVAPLIALEGASYVALRGITVESGRSHGVAITGGEHDLVAGCTIRNLGNSGVVVQDGRNHRITGCDIYHTGDGGIRMSGGERLTLSPAGHSADNNHIHHFGRWSRSYQAGVSIEGVGHRAAHNRIHDAPHNAILYWGNDVLIEFNEIYRVCMESGDVGAIYTGRDYTYRGNAIRFNFIHHLGGVAFGSCAIYMDDCVSGHEIRGNIVWGGDAIWLGGGRDFVIENNVFVNCRVGISFDARGLDKNPVWRNMVDDVMRRRLDDMDFRRPPYSTRFPEVAALDACYASGDGVPAENNRVAHNLSVGGQFLRVHWNAREEWLGLEANWVGQDPSFVDAARGDFHLRDDSPAYVMGFRQIPVDAIGLQIDEFRRAVPPREGLPESPG